MLLLKNNVSSEGRNENPFLPKETITKVDMRNVGRHSTTKYLT